MLKAGFAGVDITPPVGTALDGFLARLEPATGVDLALAARALWLDDGERAGVIIALDLLGLEPAAADRVVNRLSDRLGIDPAYVVLCCSHTHAGPMTVMIRGLGMADPQYVDRVETAVLEAADAARRNSRSVALNWASAPLELGVNRRQKNADGKAVLGSNEDGPRDRSVRALWVRGERAEPIVLFSHASHPVCIGPSESVIGGDFCGWAVRTLEKRGVRGMFINGCAGDINPRVGVAGAAVARSEGERLAGAVLGTRAGGQAAGAPTLRAAACTVELPHDELPAWAELEKIAGVSAGTSWHAHDVDPRLFERQQLSGRQWLDDLKAALARGPLPAVKVRVSVWNVGGVRLVFLPSEVFFSIGESIAASVGGGEQTVWAVAYSHGFVGYIPTPEAYPDGGYEVDEAPKYLGLWRVSPRSAGLLQEAAVRMAREVS